MELDFTFERQIELESAAAMKRGEAIGEIRGREQGIKQGIKQGIEETYRTLITKWLQNGKTVKEIAKDLGETEEFVRQVSEGVRPH